MYQRVYFINSIIIIFKCELFIYIYILFQKMRREVIINEATAHKKNNFITQQDDRRNPVKYNFI